MFLMLYPPVVLWAVLAGVASARYTTRRLWHWAERGCLCRTSATPVASRQTDLEAGAPQVKPNTLV